MGQLHFRRIVRGKLRAQYPLKLAIILRELLQGVNRGLKLTGVFARWVHPCPQVRLELDRQAGANQIVKGSVQELSQLDQVAGGGRASCLFQRDVRGPAHAEMLGHLLLRLTGRLTILRKSLAEALQIQFD
jgi:hypothetical protein